MSDDSRIITGVTVGAVLGAAAYLVFTQRGRRALDNMEATLEDVSAALEKFRVALGRADGVVHEVRGAVEDVRAALKRENPAAEA